MSQYADQDAKNWNMQSPQQKRFFFFFGGGAMCVFFK